MFRALQCLSSHSVMYRDKHRAIAYSDSRPVYLMTNHLHFLILFLKKYGVEEIIWNNFVCEAL